MGCSSAGGSSRAVATHASDLKTGDHETAARNFLHQQATFDDFVV